jgi:4-hydroxy-3-methylbut-2-enyl diphosphate reductase
VRAEASERRLQVIDATCPLVTKVHNEAKRYAEKGYFMIYIGHAGHVEAEGTMGYAPERMILVESPDDAERLELPAHERLAVLTQTTLSVDEVEKTLAVLKRRFPHLETPPKEDICYATTNRQAAVRELARRCQLVLIVGSKTSSNSNRLREVAEALGVEAHLIMSPAEIRDPWKVDYPVVGLSSGASTPEHLVEEVIGALLRPLMTPPLGPASTTRALTDSPIQPPIPRVEVLETVREDVTFRPPRQLIQLAMASE